MNVTIERKKTDCNALPKGWQREEVLRKSGLSAGKVDVYYYSPSGGKVETKSKLVRQLGETIDLSTFDYQSGCHQMPHAMASSAVASSSNSHNHTMATSSNYHRNMMRRTLADISASPSSPNTSSASASSSSPTPSKHHAHLFDFSQGIRTDASMVPPIRQTASIFKQPVTVHNNQKSKVNQELEQSSSSEKPRQLFWEKRLEGLRACDTDGSEFGPIELPRGLKPVGPNITSNTLLQSIATAIHLNNNKAIIGQTTPKSVLNVDSSVFINPEQPLMYPFQITDEDIRRQEERVMNARRKLQDALRY